MARSWFSDVQVFIRPPDVASPSFGEGVAGRAAGGLETEAVKSVVWRAD